MLDNAAFLRMICATPEDDAPRLVYADWLDEHGEQLRAEFIRLQVELARGIDEAVSTGRLTDGQKKQWKEMLGKPLDLGD